MRPMHYHRRGEPITFEEWTDLFESQRYRVVEQTHVVAAYLVDHPELRQ